MRRLLHLIRRFVTSLVPLGPSANDDAWARSRLSPAEVELWERMPRVDRRHSVGVARRAAAELGADAPSWVVPAALLHDVGKSVARLGTVGRVVATVSATVAGEDMARHWAASRGVTRRVGQYVLYPELGVDLLRLAGSAEEVAAWSREHHQPESTWTVPLAEGRVLRDADG